MSTKELKAVATGVVQERESKTLASFIQDPKIKQQLSMALPKHLTVDRLSRIILTEIRKNPKLAECTQESFLGAIMTTAQLGLEPGVIGHSYLIPFFNTKKSVLETQFMIGYRGMLDLARRSGQIQTIEARPVFKKDKFQISFGLNPNLTHEPAWEELDRGELIFVYAIAKMKDGGTQFEVMSRVEIDKIKAQSKSSSNGPWVTHYEEMAKKGLSLDTHIPTPTGWKTMEDLDRGDIVFDMEGNQTMVTSVSDIKQLPCFELTFSNNYSIICDHEHKWLARIGRSNAHREEYEEITVTEIYEAKQKGMSITIPVQGQLKIDDKSLLLDPYLLGYWLGNGSSHAAKITCHVDDYEYICSVIKNKGFEIGANYRKERSKAISVGIRKGFLDKLRKLNLLKNKHIPAEYLRGSIKQRKELLSGLLDSDGHCSVDRGRASFCSTKQNLQEAVFELASSLGEAPHCREYIAKGFGIETIAYTVEWQPTFNCFNLPRKSNKFQPRKISKYISIKDIKKIDTVSTKCIAVDSPTHTYLAGKNMAITHNTVIRRLFKYLPISIELTTAIVKDELAESGLDQGNDIFEMEQPTTKIEQKQEETKESADPWITEFDGKKE